MDPADLREATGYARLVVREADAQRFDAPKTEQLARAVVALDALINKPELEDFDKGVPLESAHQVQRWGGAHDRSKSAENWYWLIGYLAGKALRAAIAGDRAKALHHTISAAAALRNWHAAIQRDVSGAGIGRDEDLRILLFRPLLVSGTLVSTDDGPRILIDSEQPEGEQVIALWHETLHLFGLKGRRPGRGDGEAARPCLPRDPAGGEGRSPMAEERATFPLQAKARSHPSNRASVNRHVYMAIYEVYCHVHGPQPALVEGWCRGGFGVGDAMAYLYAKSFPRAEWSQRVDEALAAMDIG